MPEYVVCNLCGSDTTRVVQNAEEPYKVVRCNKCGLVYVNPQPEMLSGHYDESYYAAWRDKQSVKRRLMWQKRLLGVMDYKKGGRLLDVGCGLGTFLEVAAKRGFSVSGTEVSEYSCRYIKNTFGITVENGSLHGLNFTDGCFDVITFWHCLEHTCDPIADLKKAYKLLKNDGLLVVAVPNINNYIMRILYRIVKGKKLKLFSVDAKELHLFHFSEKTMETMLKKAGFRILRKEMDLVQILPAKRILDWLALLFYMVTRRNFSEGLKVYAVKS